MKRPKILVVGSFVMDLIVTTEQFPSAGQTVLGNGFSTAPGGKGANQAIQAARLGADVTMVGKVGNDDFGEKLIESAKTSGVNTDYVLKSEKFPSAVGNVQVQSNESGTENRIIVVPGANMDINPCEVAFLKEKISEYDMVILQNEIPMEINMLVAGYAKAKGVPVMLNPAPSAAIPDELISCLTYISPNEHETKDIIGINPTGEDKQNEAIEKFVKMGVDRVLITLGKHGCIFGDGKNLFKSDSVDCGNVIDPTAAGDSFIAAFCTAVASNSPIEQALYFANCTAGITVSRMGAQTSLPTLQEVTKIMESREN